MQFTEKRLKWQFYLWVETHVQPHDAHYWNVFGLSKGESLILWIDEIWSDDHISCVFYLLSYFHPIVFWYSVFKSRFEFDISFKETRDHSIEVLQTRTLELLDNSSNIWSLLRTWGCLSKELLVDVPQILTIEQKERVDVWISKSFKTRRIHLKMLLLSTSSWEVKVRVWLDHIWGTVFPYVFSVI